MSLVNTTFLDDAGLVSLWGKITGKLATKVDKVEGKQLSTEDYTTAEKTKLAGIEEGAQVNVLESVSVNGTALTPTSKGVDITVPTNNNQLTNGAGYQTASDVSTAITTALADVTSFEFEVVQTLPAQGVKGTIYLVPNSGAGTNVYDEYIWISTDGETYSFELLGQKELDLTNYWNGTNLTAITSARIDEITA
jgi:hypothetical protein